MAEPGLHIPDKLYFRIGEVSELLGVKPHVLRYWETEFALFKPAKTRTNLRLFKRRDIEILFAIKSLLYEDGFTIQGAKRRLKEVIRRRKERGADDESLLADVAADRKSLHQGGSRSNKEHKLERELRSYKARVSELEHDVLSKEKAITGKEDELKELVGQNSDLLRRLKDVSQALQAKEKALSELRREHVTLKGEQKVLQKEVTVVLEEVLADLEEDETGA
jgi:DNA-binding transcriptional MerR regulator